MSAKKRTIPMPILEGTNWTRRYASPTLHRALRAWIDGWMRLYRNKVGRRHGGFQTKWTLLFTQGDHLKRERRRLGIFKAYHIKCTRELDDKSQTKKDRKNPLTVAKLVKDWRYRATYIPDAVCQDRERCTDCAKRLPDPWNDCITGYLTQEEQAINIASNASVYTLANIPPQTTEVFLLDMIKFNS